MAKQRKRVSLDCYGNLASIMELSWKCHGIQFLMYCRNPVFIAYIYRNDKLKVNIRSD